MQLFGETNFDFLGKKVIFVGLSVLMALAGLVSLIAKGGPRYGIDFRGGTSVQVKFQDDPPLDRIHAALRQKGVTGTTLQPFDQPSTHQLLISLDVTGEQVGQGRKVILEALDAVFGSEPNKLDFNNASVGALADRLRNAVGGRMTPEQIEKLAKDITDFRNTSPQSGLVKNFDELQSVPGVNPDIISALKSETYLGAFTIKQVQDVGPKVGKDLQSQAMKATLLALAGMLVYIWFRFEWIYGLAAVIAVFHDVVVTVGFFSLANKEISLTVIAALLTLVGYSMNDTIVIFDRVRENLKLMRRMEFQALINASINQTLSRTILTSGLTFLTVLSLYLFGGEVLNGFSFALVVGVIVGSYSSVFVASPILIWGKEMMDKRKLVKVPVAAEKAGGRRK